MFPDSFSVTSSPANSLPGNAKPPVNCNDGRDCPGDSEFKLERRRINIIFIDLCK